MNFASDTKTIRFLDLDCVVELHGYANGRPALVLTHEGEQVAVATLRICPKSRSGRTASSSRITPRMKA